MIRLFEYRVYRTTEEPVPFCWKVLFVLFMLGTLLAMVAVCGSCQPEEEDIGNTGVGEGLSATLRLEVMGEEQVDIATRAVSEGVVSNLHILVYNSSGELIGQKYQTGSSTVTVNTRSATGCTIYAIANTGKADLFKGYAIHKESYLKSMVYSLTGWDDPGKGTNLLMTGSMKSVNIRAGVQTLSTRLVLTRMVAKVVLNIKVKESSGITITDYSVKNIPACSYYVARASGDAAQAATAAHWKESGVIATSRATSVNKTFYMFENRRGTKSISAQKDKTTANAPAKATYVVIHGLVGAVTVMWTVYLGENNTSDFNIKRNGNYTYNITLNDIAATDTRVVVDFTGTEDLSSAGTANCYLAKANSWYKFKATVRGNGAATAAGISPTGSVLAMNAPITPNIAELVWETGGHEKIIRVLMLKDGYVYFRTGEVEEGNAVIAVKNTAGIILWSWHIWVTNTNLLESAQTYRTNPRWMDPTLFRNGLVSRTLTMMDRNLGAAVDEASDANTASQAFGLYYQFGRKDPFPSGKIGGGVECIEIYDKVGNLLPMATLKGNTYQKTAAQVPHASVAENIAYTIMNPLIFIVYAVGDADTSVNWLYGASPLNSPPTIWRSSNRLWGGDLNDDMSEYPLGLDSKFIGKTIYDPCPYGWCLPPQDTWTNFTTTENPLGAGTAKDNYVSYSTTNPLYYNSPSSEKRNYDSSTVIFGRHFYVSEIGKGEIAFYPAAGYRYGKGGGIESVGDFCCAWSFAPYSASSTFGGYLYSAKIAVSPNGTSWRMHGFPVRCVKETS